MLKKLQFSERRENMQIYNKEYRKNEEDINKIFDEFSADFCEGDFLSDSVYSG